MLLPLLLHRKLVILKVWARQQMFSHICGRNSPKDPATAGYLSEAFNFTTRPVDHRFALFSEKKIDHTWLIVADDLLMLGLSSFRRKLFDFQAFHNQAYIINLSDIIIYFCGTYYLYAYHM